MAGCAAATRSLAAPWHVGLSPAVLSPLASIPTSRLPINSSQLENFKVSRLFQAAQASHLPFEETFSCSWPLLTLKTSFGESPGAGGTWDVGRTIPEGSQRVESLGHPPASEFQLELEDGCFGINITSYLFIYLYIYQAAS